MFTRKVVTASAAAFAVAALSVPLAGAQVEGSGSLESGSLESNSLGAGSLESGSAEPGSAGEGSLDTASGEDTSLGDLALETDEICELPDLGGSVAKFYPLFGLTGVPSGVLDLVTSALGSFPNLLDVVAGDGAASVGQAGSLTGPLCSTIFGGEMVQPPVTVIVDPSGTPVTTVTGTATAGSSTSATTSTSVAGSDAGSSSGSGGDGIDPATTGRTTLSTTVPVPGA